MAETRRALVVDDDPMIRRLVCAMLRSAAIAAVQAPDGQAAWDLLQHETVDVVITDRSMPEMDGVQLLRTMRGSPAHAHIPVIMLTGTTAEEAAPEAESEGVDAFLRKMAGAPELIETVNRVIAQAQTGQRPPKAG
jgi:two-component system, chemotaxis family, chemotaxis protein CheY